MENKRVRILILSFTLILIYGSIIILNQSGKKTKFDSSIPSKSLNKSSYESPIDDLRNTYGNLDIISDLKINGINLDTVVTKSSDNLFYLNHDAYGNENKFGNPYIDFRNGDNLEEERQINIYSHNYYDDSFNDYLPFSKLESYLSKEIFDKAKEIYLLTEEKKIKYEVYALKIIIDDNEHMILEAKDDALWQEHLNKLLDNTLFCTDDCHLSVDTQILVLQTCNYKPKGSYLLVIAKKIV